MSFCRGVLPLIRVASSSSTQTTHTLLQTRLYQSSIHPDRLLYPGTSWTTDRFKSSSTVPDSSGHSLFSGHIPMDEVSVTYSLSSGPGGQNVNKNRTKVDIRFKLASASWLTDVRQK